MTEPATIEVQPVSRPISVRIRPPGSKSLTNRALVVAALADGRSRLQGVLDSEDTRVMIDSLQRLGIPVRHAPEQCQCEVEGCGGRPPGESAELWIENSGTSVRFLTAVCTLGNGAYRLDGNSRMRQRPIADLVEALKRLGTEVRCELGTECPPVLVRGNGLRGGRVSVAADLSSQYTSALLMIAPCADTAVDLQLEGTVVSQPYIAMTRSVMEHFGVQVDVSRSGVFHVEPQHYVAADYQIEPDASAASYFFAAAAITQGEVTVDGLSRNSLQGDIRFVDVLEQMGCRVGWGENSVTVHGAPLRGVDVDMNAISDTAQTLSAVAVYAEGPTRIRNIAHVRHKETDRLAAVAAEMERLGIRVEEHADGLTIHPGQPQAATVKTYDDHRMAMSFALIGLRQPGIRIANPDCTSKTYPQYFDDLRAACIAGGT